MITTLADDYKVHTIIVRRCAASDVIYDRRHRRKTKLSLDMQGWVINKKIVDFLFN